ncbi:TetR/AcrR family transcriptional regulator [Hoyosella subflava]|uniref:TetR family transcriptional regulator n=1 Tax=Hoyosella subflava (strain DSM 45089 / JCM 17490 / NBRC 109087 / DQS3-9A1) TaxID=443218 RepID=F6EI50_HOYSD|nr:TetR family transcriptional regulator [Hoyosella subflava DQS3-9A1]
MEAAVALADEDGAASFSMRKLAERLQVEAMSLYHHFAGKDQILDGMVDAVFSEMEVPFGPDWKAAMRERALTARAVMTRHPWAVGLVDSRSNPGHATLRHHEAVVRCLRSAGFSVQLAAHAFALMDSYIYGFVLQEQNLPLQGAEGFEEVAGNLLAQMPAEEFPYLTEMAVEHVMQPGYSFGKEFTFGLELILDGLERELAKELL